MSCLPFDNAVAAATAGDALAGGVDVFGRWHASLELAYARRDGVTVPSLRRHRGPLRVQKHFHPEGPAVCHHIVVHPPAGIVGGDALRISVEVGTGAHALITSPGAAKWYRGACDATLELSLTLADQSVLEWLPLETIVYSGAHCAIRNHIELSGSAQLLFADVLCLGRPGSGERFDQGRWRQTGEIRRDGRLLWCEQSSVAGNDPLLDSAAGLGGATVMGSLLWVGPPVPEELHAACLALPLAGRAGATCLPDAWSARCLCDSVEEAQHWLRSVWSLLRPTMLGRAAVAPRIWAT